MNRQKRKGFNPDTQAKVAAVIKVLATKPFGRVELIKSIMDYETYLDFIDTYPEWRAKHDQANIKAYTMACERMWQAKDHKAIQMFLSRVLPQHFGKNREDQIKLNLPSALRSLLLSTDNDGLFKIKSALHALVTDEITSWQFNVCAAAVKAAHPQEKDAVEALCAGVQVLLPDNGRIKKNLADSAQKTAETEKTA